MRRLIWTDKAIGDLASIRRYIAEHHPPAARAMAKRIREVVRHLRRNPEMGKAVMERPGLRELVIDGTPYVVGYRISGGDVEIVRVKHGRELA